MALDQLDALQCTVLCTFLLFLKMTFTTFGLGAKRGEAGLRAKEDAGVGPVPENQDFTKIDIAAGLQEGQETPREQYHRWNRLVLNDLENIPFGLILAWSSYFAQGDVTVQIVGLSLLTFGRYMHSVCYVYKLMPWRSYCFAIGLSGSLALGINSVYGAFEVLG